MSSGFDLSFLEFFITTEPPTSFSGVLVHPWLYIDYLLAGYPTYLV